MDHKILKNGFARSDQETCTWRQGEEFMGGHAVPHLFGLARGTRGSLNGRIAGM